MQNEIQTIEANPMEAVEEAQVMIQVKTARKFPRNEELALTKAVQMSTSSRETAKRCLYFRPVGKKDGKMEFADGLSIRGATNIYTQWGNMAIGANPMGIIDGKLVVQGMSWDMQTNLRVMRPKSKNVTKKNGQRYSDNMIAVATDALSSLAIRTAFEANFPDAIRDRYLNAIKAAIAGSTTEEVVESWNELVKEFGKLGLTEENLKDFLKGVKKDTKTEKVVFLFGILNGITEGLFSVGDAFGFTPDLPAPVPQKTKGKEDKKDDVQTPKQRYNTAVLQAHKVIGSDQTEAIISTIEKEVKRLRDKFTDTDCEKVSGILMDSCNG